MASKLEHGTIGGYGRKCRCRRCRAAWRAYHLQRRREAREGRYFAGETASARVRLTRLGIGIARAVAARSGQSVDAVVEGALRCCGHLVTF
jgi:hypothetical protein